MVDRFSKEQRSSIMSKIKSQDTRIEKLVRNWLFSYGYRYRKNDRRLPGTPDIVIPKYKTVIFIHGCFWHKHEKCRYSNIPKTRTEFWMNKFNRNIERDKKKVALLEAMGWNVIVIWECELKYDSYLRLISLLEEIRGADYE